MTETTPEKLTEAPIIGRNEPCPCRSGKKYKRCCGAGAAPKLTMPKAPAFSPSAMGGGGAGMGGMDPRMMENFDPAMMAQVSQALQRLPRGQMQQLQVLMQKAMSGQDVTSEAAIFEKNLPPDFQNLMMSMAGSFGGAMPAGADPTPGDIEVSPASTPESMTLDKAREVILNAMADGSLSREEGEKLLQTNTGTPAPVATPALPRLSAPAQAPAPTEATPPPTTGGKFWSKFVGKKDAK